MARKVEQVRPRPEREPSSEVELESMSRRQAKRLLENVTPDDPPRRLSAAGLVVIGCVVACAAFYLLGFLAARLGGH
jgi:hypothetical protein